MIICYSLSTTLLSDSHWIGNPTDHSGTTVCVHRAAWARFFLTMSDSANLTSIGRLRKPRVLCGWPLLLTFCALLAGWEFLRLFQKFQSSSDREGHPSIIFQALWNETAISKRLHYKATVHAAFKENDQCLKLLLAQYCLISHEFGAFS